jgi:hypothetical protein
MTTPLPGQRVTWIDRLDPFHPRQCSGRVYSLRRHGGYWFAVIETDSPLGADVCMIVVALGLLEQAKEVEP